MSGKRGAPPGNKNAFKHGFYSRQFRQRELHDLSTLATPTLEDEIAAIRVTMLRFLTAVRRRRYDRDLDSELAIVRAVTQGTASINGLVRTHLMLARRGLTLAELLDGWRTLGTGALDYETTAPGGSEPPL